MSTDMSHLPKTGGRPPNPEAVASAMQFKNFRAQPSSVQSAAVAVPVLPTVPASVDNQSSLPNWQMLGNDVHGDCNAVAWANIRRLVSAKLGNKEVYPSQDQVYQFYKTQNPGFTKEDHGMDTLEGLQWLKQNGGPDGAKPIAFAAVDVKNLDEVKAAIATFGSLYLGIILVDHNYSEFMAGKPLTAQSSSKPYGGLTGSGHVVMAAGYDANDQIQFVSWGKTGTFSKQWWFGSTTWTPTLVTDAWVVIWPEHMGTRRFWAGVDTSLLDQEYQRVYQDMNNAWFSDNVPTSFPVSPLDTLWFAQNCYVDNITLAGCSPDGDYAMQDKYANTPILPGEAASGTFVFENGDFYFIKTANLGSGWIEVHRVSSSSSFTQFDMHFTSCFPASYIDNGAFTIDNGDLYQIKTQNTANNSIEVHSANHIGNFQTFNNHCITAFSNADAANGHFILKGGDLYYIKTMNTASGHLELYISDGEQNYSNTRSYITSFTNAFPGQENGFFSIDGKGNLYFVRKTGAPSGRVEVHMVSAESGYQTLEKHSSVFTQDWNAFGTFIMG